MIPDDNDDGNGNIGISRGLEWPPPPSSAMSPSRDRRSEYLKGEDGGRRCGQMPSIVGVLCVSPPGHIIG